LLSIPEEAPLSPEYPAEEDCVMTDPDTPREDGRPPAPGQPVNPEQEKKAEQWVKDPDNPVTAGQEAS
jgi:hypothetical protein